MPDADYEGELKQAIASLYDTFESYHLNSNIRGCPCCVAESDLQAIKEKVLTNLTASDLNHFAFKAMTTWGTVEDFKHFLPRLLELLPFDRNFYWSDVVIGKLAYADFSNWQQEEKDSIDTYLFALWNYVLSQYPSLTIEPSELMKRLMDITDDLDRYLLAWQNNSSSNSLIHLSEFINREIEFNISPIKIHCLSSTDTQIFLNWLVQKEMLEKLEQGFFSNFDSFKKHHADQIAISFDVLDYAIDQKQFS